MSAARQDNPYFQRLKLLTGYLFVNHRFNQSKYFTKQSPSYLNKIFELPCLSNLRTSNNYLKLICSFRKLTQEKTHALSSFIPQYGIKCIIKTFEHNFKRYHLTQLKEAESKYWYYCYYNYRFLNYLLLLLLLLLYCYYYTVSVIATVTIINYCYYYYYYYY